MPILTYSSSYCSFGFATTVGSASVVVSPSSTITMAGSYYGFMKKASVADLKNQISRYFDYVRHGETVLVLDRRVPVAELKPVTGRPSNGKLVALERKGIIRLGSGEILEKFSKEKLGGK